MRAVLPITPRFARWLLDTTNHEPIQRDLEPIRVLHFAERISSGQFHLEPPIAFGWRANGLTLTNGQHRLQAIALGDVTVHVQVEYPDHVSWEGN